MKVKKLSWPDCFQSRSLFSRKLAVNIFHRRDRTREKNQKDSINKFSFLNSTRKKRIYMANEFILVTLVNFLLKTISNKKPPLFQIRFRSSQPFFWHERKKLSNHLFALKISVFFWLLKSLILSWTLTLTLTLSLTLNTHFKNFRKKKFLNIKKNIFEGEFFSLIYI